MKKNFTSLSLLLACLTLISCTRSSPERKSTVSRDTFRSVYIDLLIVNEGRPIPEPESLGNITRTVSAESILIKHNVTREQLLETVAQYSKDLTMWKDFYDDVIKQLEEMQRKSQQKTQRSGG